MREIGPLNKEELKVWQERNALLVDGEFGNQCMGQVLDHEIKLSSLLETIRSLKKRVDTWEMQYDSLRAAFKLELSKTWWDKLREKF